MCIHVVLLRKAALTLVITALQEGQVLKIINRLSVVPMTLDILQVSSIRNLSFVIPYISNRGCTQLFIICIILLFCQSQCNLCSFNVSKTTRYLDMRCSNCSQTLLQRFNDAVITSIFSCLMKVGHSIIEMLQ